MSVDSLPMQVSYIWKHFDAQALRRFPTFYNSLRSWKIYFEMVYLLVIVLISFQIPKTAINVIVPLRALPIIINKQLLFPIVNLIFHHYSILGRSTGICLADCLFLILQNM